MMKRLIRDTRGAALVELALTAPLLLLITIGGAELGRVAYAAIEVESAARAGASYGAVNIDNALNSSSTVQQAAYNDAPNITDMTATVGTACVCETYNSSTKTASYNPSSGTTSCGASAITSCTTDNATTTQSTINYVTVTTQATVPTMFHYPGIPTSFTVNGYSEMRVLQN